MELNRLQSITRATTSGATDSEGMQLKKIADTLKNIIRLTKEQEGSKLRIEDGDNEPTILDQLKEKLKDDLEKLGKLNPKMAEFLSKAINKAKGSKELETVLNTMKLAGY